MINIELTDNTIEYDGYTLYKIKAINPYKHNKVYKLYKEVEKMIIPGNK